MQAILPSQLKTGVLMADRRAMVSSRTLPMRPPRRTVAASCPADDSHEDERVGSMRSVADMAADRDLTKRRTAARAWIAPWLIARQHERSAGVQTRLVCSGSGSFSDEQLRAALARLLCTSSWDEAMFAAAADKALANPPPGHETFTPLP